MTQPKDTSANEVEVLIYKAARGGGLPLGYAEDLAAAARYLDLETLSECPCSGATPLAQRVQTALDLTAAGEGPQTVTGDSAVIESYVAATQAAWQKRLVWMATDTGATFERFEDTPPDPTPPKGRRKIPVELADHLSDMACKLLVPETEASRQGGAGAGLTDND